MSIPSGQGGVEACLYIRLAFGQRYLGFRCCALLFLWRVVCGGEEGLEHWTKVAPQVNGKWDEDHVFQN